MGNNVNAFLEEIKSDIKSLRDDFDNAKRDRKVHQVCLCGCGRELVQPKTGGRKKFFSEACRKRYDRREQKLLSLEKKMRSKPIKQLSQGAA